MLVYGWKDASISPILIMENRFNNNFALRFGLSVVLINFEADYFFLWHNRKCGGIKIWKNEVKLGTGCPKTFGNFIIACIPQDP